MTYSSGYTRIGFPRPTPAIARLMIVNVVVFVANMVLVGRLSEGGPTGGGLWFALSWSGLWEGYGLGLLRFVSYQFTHSWQDPMHLLGNGIFLYFFGGIAERTLLGYLGTLKVYLLGGVFAGVAHMALYGLVFGQSVPVVGASGSVYALALYACCARPRQEVYVLFFNFQLLFAGLLLVALGLYNTYVELVGGGMHGGVSHGAHLGGALFGFLVWRFGWLRDYRDDPDASLFGGLGQRLRRWRAQKVAEDAAAQQREVDRILEKIQQHGMPSLSGAERRVLERASERAKKR